MSKSKDFGDFDFDNFFPETRDSSWRATRESRLPGGLPLRAWAPSPIVENSELLFYFQIEKKQKIFKVSKSPMKWNASLYPALVFRELGKSWKL